MAILVTRVKDLPPAVWEHLKLSITKGRVDATILARLKQWLDDKKDGYEVPDGDWFKSFGKAYLCGRGQYPLTFRTYEMGAKGIRIASIPLNFRNELEARDDYTLIDTGVKCAGFLMLLGGETEVTLYPVRSAPKSMEHIAFLMDKELNDIRASYVTANLGYVSRDALLRGLKRAAYAPKFSEWPEHFAAMITETEFGEMKNGDSLANYYEDFDSRGVQTDANPREDIVGVYAGPGSKEPRPKAPVDPDDELANMAPEDFFK